MAQNITTINALSSLVLFLSENNYEAINVLPLRQYPFSQKIIPNEFNNILKLFLNRSNLFSISVLPDIYKNMVSKPVIELNEAFFVNKPLSKQKFQRILGKDLIIKLTYGQVIKDSPRGLYSVHRIVPYKRKFFVTSRFDRSLENFTFLSYDSLFLADFVKKRLIEINSRYQKGLDLCCGMGIQAFVMSEFCDVVTGIDMNENAIAYAELNAEINNFRSCNFIAGNVMESDFGIYDLIVANPPFIFYEQEEGNPLDSQGGEPYGLKITSEILGKLDGWLTGRGRAFVLTRSPIIEGNDYLFKEIKKWMSGNLGCIYHYVSDSVVPLLPFETAQGISGYRNLILEISRGNEIVMKKYPFWKRRTTLF